MKYFIKTIPHKSQRYETCGDYYDGLFGVTHFRISKMDNPDYEFLISIHEQIEHYLIQKRGLPISEIDAFDIMFEKEREAGLHTIDEEPGFDPRSPYLDEHAFATLIERQLADKLQVDWQKYSDTVNNL